MQGTTRHRRPRAAGHDAVARLDRLQLPAAAWAAGAAARSGEQGVGGDVDAPPAAGPVAAALAARLPGTVRGGRLALDGRAVAALAVLAVLALVLGLGYARRSAPTAVAVPQVLASGGPAAAATTSPVVPDTAASGSVAAFVVVDVAGRVRRPGIVRLPAGSRVVDALKAAGGVRPGVDLAGVNQARPLVDGEQVLVGLPAGSGASAAAGAGPADGSGVLDLNAATSEQLEGLPGVGPVLAQRIVDWRTEHGRFNTVDELREVSGIGDKIFAELEPRVRV